MNLNIQDWKEFKIPSLFDVNAGIYHYSDEYEDGDTPYVSASDTNNGIGNYISLRPDFEGNKITTGKVGCTAYYQPDAFCATSDVNVLSPKFDMSAEIGMFISRIINFNENYKWAYGRQCRVGNTKAISIKLPIQHNPDGTPVIDADKTYSDEEYIPDWQFMEDYIKSLHHKPLTTKNKKGQAPDLNLGNWEPFNVGHLFTMLNGKGITKEEINENGGSLIAVQSGEEDNGVMGKIDLNYCKKMNYTYSEKPCLTVARSGSAGFVSYQHDGCVVGDSAKILLLPDDVATTEHYLFLQTILTANRFKYTYGRKVTEDKYLNDVIDLPVQYNTDGSIFVDSSCKYSDNGYVPDWDFMENYIKSLPYGDRL